MTADQPATARRSARIASRPEVPAAPGPSIKKKAPAAKKKAADSKKKGEASDGEGGTVDPNAAPEGNVAASAVKTAKPFAPALNVGEFIYPELSVVNQKGEAVKVLDLVKEKGAVFFMYPKADTPGCTNQAKGFRDLHSEFAEKGYNVFGLSADKPAAQLKWAEKHTLPYDLLSDPGFETIAAFGAHGPGNKIIRSHVVVAKGGEVKEKKIKISPADSFKDACEFVKGARK
ncbi:hypothetical protein HDU89_002402 [Geranomyces variabilis]|nr:hypothetical protein HDU89_002402 [Geranomyces variabilis]